MRCYWRSCSATGQDCGYLGTQARLPHRPDNIRGRQRIGGISYLDRHVDLRAQYRQSVLRSSCLPRFPRVNRIPRQIPRNSLWCVGRGNFRCGSGRTLAGGALTEWVSWYSRLSRARPRLVGAPILIQLLWLDLVRKRGYFTGSARAHGFGRGLRAVNQVGKAPRAGSPLGAVVS